MNAARIIIPVGLEPVLGTDDWRLIRRAQAYARGYLLTLEPFQFGLTDGVSSGLLMARIYPALSPATIDGAVHHDWLFRSQLLPEDACDAIFLDLCLAAAVSDVQRAKAYAAYAGLRAGGWVAYGRAARRPTTIHLYREHMTVEWIGDGPLPAAA